MSDWPYIVGGVAAGAYLLFGKPRGRGTAAPAPAPPGTAPYHGLGNLPARGAEQTTGAEVGAAPAGSETDRDVAPTDLSESEPWWFTLGHPGTVEAPGDWRYDEPVDRFAPVRPLGRAIFYRQVWEPASKIAPNEVGERAWALIAQYLAAPYSFTVNGRTSDYPQGLVTPGWPIRQETSRLRDTVDPNIGAAALATTVKVFSWLGNFVGEIVTLIWPAAGAVVNLGDTIATAITGESNKQRMSRADAMQAASDMRAKVEAARPGNLLALQSPREFPPRFDDYGNISSQTFPQAPVWYGPRGERFYPRLSILQPGDQSQGRFVDPFPFNSVEAGALLPLRERINLQARIYRGLDVLGAIFWPSERAVTEWAGDGTFNSSGVIIRGYAQDDPGTFSYYCGGAYMIGATLPPLGPACEEIPDRLPPLGPWPGTTASTDGKPPEALTAPAVRTPSENLSAAVAAPTGGTAPRASVSAGVTWRGRI